MESVDDSPGFNSSVLVTLRDLVLKDPTTYKWCTLLLDAMAIRQKVEYDQIKGKMFGFVDPAFGSATDEAKEVLVLMVVGMQGHWKMPIGYFLTRSLTGTVQCQLVLEGLRLLHDAGHCVIGVTMDGHATNIAMCSLLGCDLDPNDLRTSFTDPASKRTLYVFFDPCHMLKLVRNMLESYTVIVSSDGKVNWEYVKQLHIIQVGIQSQTQGGFCVLKSAIIVNFIKSPY